MRLLPTTVILSSLLALSTSCGDDDGFDATCGNNILELGELCDDGNTISGDGCSSVCLLEAGGPDANLNLADADPGPDRDPNAPDATPSPDGTPLPDAGPQPDGPPPGTVVLNEFVFNNLDGATNPFDSFEYIEIFGSANTDYSNLTVIVIEGDTGGGVSGTIDFAMSVGTTNATGHWDTGVLMNTLENGSQTALLVDGFSGSVGTDLDTNDDGTLDATPWTSILDAVAVEDNNGINVSYGAPLLLRDFDGQESLSPPSGAIGGASRIPDGMDTNQISDWVRNDRAIPPGGTTSGSASNTPGTANILNP